MGCRSIKRLEARFVFPVVFAEGCFHQAGRDGVHAHAPRAEFQRVGLRQHDERGLGHAVEQALELGANAGDGRDVDDGSGAALAHPGRHQARQPVGALQIDLDHFVELGVGHLERRTLRDVGAGVVDQNVDLAELARGAIHQALQIFEPADVAGDGDECGRPVSLIARDLIQSLLLAAADDHRRAFAREQLRDGSPDASAGAGNDRDFVL